MNTVNSIISFFQKSKLEMASKSLFFVVTLGIGIVIFLLNPSLGLAVAFLFMVAMIFYYQVATHHPLRWFIISVFLTGVISPTALSTLLFRKGSFKVFFSFIGGVSLGAVILTIWILMGFCVAFYKPSILLRIVKKNPLHPLFLLYAGVSISFAPHIGEAVQAFGRLLAPYFLLLLFYFYLTEEVGAGENDIYPYYNRIGICILISGPILAISGLNKAVILDPTRGLRYTGLFLTTPNAYIAVCAFFTIYFLSQNVCSQRKRRNLILAALFTITCILTRARTGLAAFFAALSVWVILSRTKAVTKVVSISIIVCIAILLTQTGIGRSFVYSKGISFKVAIKGVLREPANWHKYIFSSGRDTLWKLVWNQAFVGNELFGSGAGASTYYTLKHEAGAGVVHGEYVRLLSEYGIVGTAIYLGAMMVWVLLAFQSTSDFERMIIVPMFVYLLVNMIAENILDYISQFWLYLVSMIAIGLSRSVPEKNSMLYIKRNDI
jgi:hypothetical protein